ncbi:hypothetical protein KAI52_02545 [Candidatus Parcubacteria bacterium]|nr:hypothetical protein [Candidatus Parcubacteria bacterium]
MAGKEVCPICGAEKTKKMDALGREWLKCPKCDGGVYVFPRVFPKKDRDEIKANHLHGLA